MGINYNKVTNNSGTAVRIGEVRFSYPKFFEPDEDGKYGCCVLIPKENTQAIELVKKATDVAAQNGASKFWKGKVPAMLKRPLRDGDEEKPEDPGYAGCYFFNCKNKYQPDVGVLDGGIMTPATQRDVYPGCYGAVVVEFFAYDNNGNRGVSASLGNVIKTRDGERLAGGIESMESSFGDLCD